MLKLQSNPVDTGVIHYFSHNFAYLCSDLLGKVLTLEEYSFI